MQKFGKPPFYIDSEGFISVNVFAMFPSYLFAHFLYELHELFPEKLWLLCAHCNVILNCLNDSVLAVCDGDLEIWLLLFDLRFNLCSQPMQICVHYRLCLIEDNQYVKLFSMS